MAVSTAGLCVAPSGPSTLHLRMRSSAPRRVDFSRAAPRAAPRQRGTRHSCRCLQTAAMTAASCRAELSTTPSGLRPGSTSSCSLATWHVALMLVPPDGCDDNDVFDCGARHHAERFSTGAAPHACPQRGMRHSCRCLSTAATTAESSTAELGNTPSGLRPGQHHMLLLGNVARGTHVGASRRLR